MENKKNNLAPTMFIDTVSTNIISNHSQSIFDSRNKNNTTWKSSKNEEVIYQKINGMIQLIKAGCKIKVLILTNTVNIEGYLKEKKEQYLYIVNVEGIKEIEISNIKDIVILS